jgi:hypothetical protein
MTFAWPETLCTFCINTLHRVDQKGPLHGLGKSMPSKMRVDNPVLSGCFESLQSGYLTKQPVLLSVMQEVIWLRCESQGAGRRLERVWVLMLCCPPSSVQEAHVFFPTPGGLRIAAHIDKA